MENLRDKMLKAIESFPDVDRYHENYEAYAEACARVAEEEIAKAFDEAYYSAWYNGNYGIEDQREELKDKYLKSLK